MKEQKKKTEESQLSNQINFDPTTNDKVISIILQEDGNYKGYTQKFGKLVEVRAGDPQTVLVMLITHNGN